MRHLIVLCAVALLAGPADAQRRAVERRYAVTPTASIRLTAVSQQTTLRVIGWDRDSLVFSGDVGAAARVDGGVGAGGRGAKLFVETPSANATAPAQLELRVPAQSRLWVKLGAGDVEITGLRGAIDVNVVSGAVTITGDLRELNAEAMDGAITIAGRAGWLRAKTAGGTITVTGGGDDVGLTSVSGAVHLRGGPVARARIETVTGDVTTAATVERGGQLTIDSHSGRVEYRLPPKDGVYIDVATVNGTVTNRLTDDRALPGMSARGLELGTTVGAGGRSITIRTFKGPVVLVPDIGAK
jgi:hypothetical protein